MITFPFHVMLIASVFGKVIPIPLYGCGIWILKQNNIKR
jgi:hypothetical protein